MQGFTGNGKNGKLFRQEAITQATA